jgi:Ca2+-binding RTX toxin-like protein
MTVTWKPNGAIVAVAGKSYAGENAMPTRKWGNEKLVNTTTAGDQQNSDVAVLADGGFVVVWEDDSGADTAIRAQRYDAVGGKVGSEILIFSSAGFDQLAPAVTGLAGGGFYVTWSTERSSTNFDITGKVYNANGVDLGFLEPIPFNIFDPDTNNQTDPDVARIGTGLASVAVWTDLSVNSGDIRARFFDAAGVASAVINVNTTTAGSQANPSVAVSPDGSTVAIVWNDVSDSSIKGRLFNAAGAESAPQFRVDVPVGGSLFIFDPVVAWLNDGNFVVVWREGHFFNAGSNEIRARIFGVFPPGQSAEPVALTGNIPVNSTIADSQQNPMVAALPNGGFVVAWEDFSGVGVDSNPGAIRLQAFDGAGGKIGGEIVVNTTTTDGQFGPSIAALPDGRVVVSWTDFSQTGGDTSGYAIRMQIVDPRDGIVTGTGGDDTLYGHDLVNDEMSGGAGNDLLRGMRGDDALYGGAGNDTLLGQKGDDLLYGGEGNDALCGGNGDDELYGEGGNDTFRMSLGADVLDGGAGADSMNFTSFETTTGVKVNLAAGNFKLPGGVVQTFTSIERIIGTAFADSLTGNASANLLNGAGGKDTLSGAGGKDTLTGGLGADRLTGGAGADRFDFNDVAESGTAALARDTITDFGQGSDKIDLFTIDANTGLGGNQAFTFIGSAAFSAPGQVRAIQSNGNTLVQLSNDGDTSPEMAITLTGLFTLSNADFVL